MSFNVINSYESLPSSSFVVHLDGGIVVSGNKMRQLFTDNEYCWERYSEQTALASIQNLANGVKIEFEKGSINPPPPPRVAPIDLTKSPDTYYDSTGNAINYFDTTLYGGLGGVALVYPGLKTSSGWAWNGSNWEVYVETPREIRFIFNNLGKYVYQYLKENIYRVNSNFETVLGDQIWEDLEEGFILDNFIWRNNRWAVNNRVATIPKPDPNIPPPTKRRLVAIGATRYQDRPLYYWDFRLISGWANLYQGLVVGKFRWNGTAWEDTGATLEWNPESSRWLVIEGVAETEPVMATSILTPPDFVSGDFYTQAICYGLLKDNKRKMPVETRWKVVPHIILPRKEVYNTTYPINPARETGYLNYLQLIVLPVRDKEEFLEIDFKAEYKVTIDGKPATIILSEGLGSPPKIESLNPYEVIFYRNGLIQFYLAKVADHIVYSPNRSEYTWGYDERFIRPADNGDLSPVPVVVEYFWKMK